MKITFGDRVALALTELRSQLDAREVSRLDIERVIRHWTTSDLSQLDDDSARLDLSDYNNLAAQVWMWVEHAVSHGHLTTDSSDTDSE
jgi:hypothetical protein